jgi:hypothetical protein
MTSERVRYLGIDSLSQCEENERLIDLQNKIIQPNRGNFIPELSPDYNPNTGMVETNYRPVRMIEDDPANKGIIAKKWIVKD